MPAADTIDMLSRAPIIVISLLTGIGLELGIYALSGRREAWDAPQYWTIGLPSAMVVSFIIGALSPDRAWRWTWLIVPAQVLTMMARAGDLGFNLWPLTAALSAILSAPFALAAFVGSRFRRQA